jgi:hypothetical protein
LKTVVTCVIAAIRLKKGQNTTKVLKKLPPSLDAAIGLSALLEKVKIRIAKQEDEMARLSYMMNAKLHTELR